MRSPHAVKSAMSCAPAAVAFACAAPAMSADTPPSVAPPVTVTATRVDSAVASYLVGARVISAQDIQRSRAANVSELLRARPEVRTRELAGSPNPLIDLRGFGTFGDQNTLVLIDGMRVREYEQLSVNWSAIPLDSIERIEILPASGAAVLFGGGATGGAINIVTRSPQRRTRSAYVGAGLASYETHDARAGGSIARDAIGLRLHGSHYRTDNYRDNNRVRIDSAQADVRWADDMRSLALKVGADDQRLGLPGVLSEAQIAADRRQASTPRDVAAQDGRYAQVTAGAPVGAADLEVALGYRERDTNASFLVGTPFRNTVDTTVYVWTLAPRLRLKPQWPGSGGDLILGADYESWKFDANAQPAIVSRPHSTQRSTAVYAQYAVRFATLTTVAAGARHQDVRYDVIDRANVASTGARRHTLRAWDVSVRQTLPIAAAAYMKVGSSFRLPNVNDNFNPSFARVTLLEPQRAREIEAGVEGESGPFRYRAAAYRMELENEIFFDPVTLGTRNRQPTRREAFDLEVRWAAGATLELNASYTYADARFRDGIVRGLPIAGNRVPLAPRETLAAGLSWWFCAEGRADFDVRYIGSSAFDADEAGTFGRRIPSYTVADLTLSARSGGWLLKGGVRNIFNEKYLTYGVFTGRPTFSAFTAPERNVFVSAQYTFQ